MEKENSFFLLEFNQKEKQMTRRLTKEWEEFVNSFFIQHNIRSRTPSIVDGRRLRQRAEGNCSELCNGEHV